MQKKLLYFLITLFATATLVSGYWIVEGQKIKTPENEPITITESQYDDRQEVAEEEQEIESNTEDTVNYRSTTTQTISDPNHQETKPPAEATIAPDEETNPYEIFEAKVTLAIDGKNLHIPYHDSMTAERAMREVAQRYPESFHYEGIEYGGDLGTFVTAINGKKENPQEKMRWILYLNGSASNKGISTLKLNPDDILSWNYEKETL